MAVDKRVFIFIASSVMALVCILYIVSNALPSWAKGKDPATGFTAESGLWRACFTILEVKQCGSIGSCAGSRCGRLYGARAFMILVCIVSALSVGIILFNLVQSSSNQMTLIGAKVAPIVSLVFGIIGVALGISFYSGGNGTLGAASILGIVALAGNLIGAILTALIR